MFDCVTAFAITCGFSLISKFKRLFAILVKFEVYKVFFGPSFNLELTQNVYYTFRLFIILQNGANISKFYFKLINQMIFWRLAKFVGLSNQQTGCYFDK